MSKLKSIGRVLAYLPISIELVIVILLAAAWGEAIQNVALSSVIMTVLPAIIGIGLGATLVKNSKSHQQRLLENDEAIENHPYLKAIREAFGEPTYAFAGKARTAKQLAELHNHLPSRLKLRSQMLHPMVEDEMEDWEYSGLEQMTVVPTPEPWITYEEETAVAIMVDNLYGDALKGLNLSFPEMLDYTGKIERSILRNLKNLNSLPWPQLVIDEEQEAIRYSANGSITGHRETG